MLATRPLSRYRFPETLTKEQTERVNERVARVYGYTAGAFASSCATAMISAKTGIAWKVISLMNSFLSSLGLAAAGIALLAATYFTPKEDAVQKHALFGLFTVWQGLVISPLVLLGGTTFAAAAATTTAVMGGLGVLAMRMKENFERYEKILLIALVAIGLASLGTLCLSGAAAAYADKISLVGGLALFSALTIYDTHRGRRAALKKDFDEINHSIDIYTDAMNLFVRIWEIFDRKKNHR